MNNLIKINDDLVVMDNVDVHFKNYVVGNFDSKESLCMIYFWDTYIMSIDEAMYISRDPSVMQEQFDFIKDLIASEIYSNLEVSEKDGNITYWLPFVSSTISKKDMGGYNILTEVSIDRSLGFSSTTATDLERAKELAIESSYKLSSDMVVEQNFKAWEQLRK